MDTYKTRLKFAPLGTGQLGGGGASQGPVIQNPDEIKSGKIKVICHMAVLEEAKKNSCHCTPRVVSQLGQAPEAVNLPDGGYSS